MTETLLKFHIIHYVDIQYVSIHTCCHACNWQKGRQRYFFYSSRSSEVANSIDLVQIAWQTVDSGQTALLAWQTII